MVVIRFLIYNLVNVSCSDLLCPFPQEEFLSLCVDKLAEIIASDYVNVPREEMAFEAAMLWLKKCPTEFHLRLRDL